MAKTYRPEDIEHLPDLCVAQCCTLKVDTGTRRVWICRVAGGVTVESYDGRRWNTTSGSCSAREAST